MYNTPESFTLLVFLLNINECIGLVHPDSEQAMFSCCDKLKRYFLYQYDDYSNNRKKHSMRLKKHHAIKAWSIQTMQFSERNIYHTLCGFVEE